MKNNSLLGIIPARMASSRFPGKPLAPIGSIPMIGHVYYRCAMSASLEEVFIATCDQEIADYAASINAPCIMTSDTHERASDRIAEAMLTIEKRRGKKADIVVMIQGDEPMLVPEMIDLAVDPLLKDPAIQVSNLMAPLQSHEEHDDPHEIKVVVDENGFALYFSREPIPTRKKGARELPMLKQVCVIPFRRDYLITFNKLKPTALEIAESIDMLRILEHGGKVKMVNSPFITYSVDTPADLAKVEKYIRQDTLTQKYPGKKNA